MRMLGRSSAVSLVPSLHCTTGFAQDQMYSQIFKSPLIYNPALTGQINSGLRMNLTCKNYGITVAGNFSHILAPVDYNVPQLGPGINSLTAHKRI